MSAVLFDLDAIGLTWGFGGTMGLEAAGTARSCADPPAVFAALGELFGRPPRAVMGADGSH